MRSGVMVVLVGLLVWPGVGSAEPTAEDKLKARPHFERGQAAYNAGRYDDAIAEYLRAYDFAPAPALLFNVAQALRLKGDKPRALDYYRKFLEAARSDDAKSQRVREEAQGHADRLARELGQSGPASAPIAAPTAVTAAEPVATNPAAATTLPPAQDEGRPGASLRIAGIATGIAGLVTLGMGVKFGLDAKDLESQVVNKDWSADLDQKVQDGYAAETKGVALMVAGGALAVGGVVLYLIGSSRGNDTTARSSLRTRWAIVPAADGGAAVISGHF